jgi:hypothetical protein
VAGALGLLGTTEKRTTRGYSRFARHTARKCIAAGARVCVLLPATSLCKARGGGSAARQRAPLARTCGPSSKPHQPPTTPCLYLASLCVVCGARPTLSLCELHPLSATPLSALPIEPHTLVVALCLRLAVSISIPLPKKARKKTLRIFLSPFSRPLIRGGYKVEIGPLCILALSLSLSLSLSFSLIFINRKVKIGSQEGQNPGKGEQAGTRGRFRGGN